MGKPRRAWVYTDQRLNLSTLWEGPRKKCQGFKPDPGNPAVRDYRGASGNVSHGGNVHPSCNRKSRKRKPPPTAWRARSLSQSHLQRGAPDFYPNQFAPTSPTSPNRVPPGRPEWRSRLLNAETPQAAIESRAIATVTIVNQVTAVAIDPKRSTPLFAGLPTLLSKTALSQRARFSGSSAGLQRRHRASDTGLFGSRRNRTLICSIHGASRIFTNPKTAFDRVANSYILRQSSQKP